MGPSRPEMVAFLKKYSAADNAFVDDFFGIVDPVSADTFSVNLDSASKWLHVRKAALMQTLRASYKQDDDYTVSKPATKLSGRGRNTLRIVMLTPDCFKNLCMQSRSEKGEEVRKYFRAVEKTLMRYRAEIMTAMDARIQQLENNQRPKSRSSTPQGVVYVIPAAKGVSRYKVGRTIRMARRMASHSSALADDVEPEFVYNTQFPKQVEACVKGVLGNVQYRTYKEVYEADINDIKKAIETCGDMITSVQAKHDRGKKKNKPMLMVGGARRGFIAITGLP